MTVLDKTNTPDELLDQVDGNDNVIGTITKKVANSNPEIFHREIRVILFDHQGRVLLQKRSPKKKVYPNCWAESCQGHVPSGMDYEKAAHKELQEELGFDTDLKFAGKTLIRFPNETHFAVWFVGKYQGESLTLEPEEVVDVRVANREDFAQLVAEEKAIDSSVKMIDLLWTEVALVN